LVIYLKLIQKDLISKPLFYWISH